ncbi:uncharacterized protein LOC119312240 [Triticum dicoccoides]|uniref:uncharacterized protein LOC119312240 n=1 Tax=Triticum dicoccoides TaxID=85692 RepID=UPI000E7CD593|nr:uncharacterized protein LOC119312240 [Triticum dicoccoides]
MPTEGEPQPEEGTGVLPNPDWVMLGRIGRTRCHNSLGAARVAVNKNKTAALLHMAGGPFCYVSFTLAAPRKGVSYLNLHWPEGQDAAIPPAYPSVRAADKELILFDISTPAQTDSYLVPPDLFVYTAAGSSPSVQRLPPCTERGKKPFLMDNLATGILRLKAEDRYIVADLNVYSEEAGLRAELCVFDSYLNKWEITPKIAFDDHINGGQFTNLWSTHHVFAFAGRFLCWIDYFSGVLLCDFSMTDSPVLRFVPFPGEKEYHDKVRVENYLPERFRSVSISQGKMRFVHIDNDFHDRLHDPSQWIQLPERKSHEQHQPPQKITIWTLNSKFEWDLHHDISLHRLWGQPAYRALGIHQRLPEFPIISADDPYVLCCTLREKEFRGKRWMIMVDGHACVRSCTPESESADAKAHHAQFHTVPLLPTVFCKYLERPAGMTSENDKVTTLSKKHKRAGFLSKNRKLKCVR